MSHTGVMPRLLRAAAILLGCWSGVCCAARPVEYDVVELAPDGLWTWYSDERAIVYDGKLYTGYVSSKGKIGVSSYDFATGAKAHSGPLNSWTQLDDHINPSLLALPGGRVMALYARHFGSSYQTRITRLPGDVTAWEDERLYDPRVQIAFSHLIRLNAEAGEGGGRIYNFTRAIAMDPCLTYSEDNGTTWSDLIHIVQSDQDKASPYFKLSGNGKDRIDILLTDAHPRGQPDNSIYHCYYRYNPVQDRGAFFRSDGSGITTLPAILKGRRFFPSDATRVYDGGSASGRAWTHDVALDPRGRLAAVYSTRTGSNDLRYRYARWDGKRKKWREGQIAFAGNYLCRPEFDYAGGIVLDPDDVNVAYFSSNVDPRTGASVEDGEYEIYRAITFDDGQSWNIRALTHDSVVRNIRPFVPRGHATAVAVLWCRGMYKSYERYQTSVVGIFSDQEP